MNKIWINFALYALSKIKVNSAFMNAEVKDARSALLFLKRIS